MNGIPACSAICRARRRSAPIGEISAVTAMTPFSASSRATSATRRAFSERSPGEKPRSAFNPFLKASPSSTDVGRPRRLSSRCSARASVDLPAPDKPVNQTIAASVRKGMDLMPAWSSKTIDRAKRQERRRNPRKTGGPRPGPGRAADRRIGPPTAGGWHSFFCFYRPAGAALRWIDSGRCWPYLDKERGGPEVSMLYKTMLERIRAEYLEMPGLRLTPGQVQRLCGVDRELCQSILDALVDAKFLGVRPDGAVERLTDGPPSRPALPPEQMTGPVKMLRAY